MGCVPTSVSVPVQCTLVLVSVWVLARNTPSPPVCVWIGTELLPVVLHAIIIESNNYGTTDGPHHRL